MSEFSLDKAKERAQKSAEGVVSGFREFLGVEFEQFVCPSCKVPCEASTTFDVNRAAFDNGESPSWYCSECDSHYVREQNEAESLTGDMYGRG